VPVPKRLPAESRFSGLLPERHFAASIYGTILVTAVLVSVSEGGLSVGERIAALFTTTSVFALAHAWANALEHSAEAHAPVTAAGFSRTFGAEWPIIEAAVPTGVLLALAWADVYSTAVGVSLAIAVNVTQLFVWGAALRHRAGGGPVHMAASGAGTALFGVGLVVLKILVH
jgi:hypothetical protein